MSCLILVVLALFVVSAVIAIVYDTAIPTGGHRRHGRSALMDILWLIIGGVYVGILFFLIALIGRRR